MPRLRSSHRAQRDGAVEGSEAAAVFHGKRQQIQVGDLIGSKNAAWIEDGGVRDREVVWPEHVVGRFDLFGETTDSLGCRQRRAISSLRDNSCKAVLGQRARGPAILLIGLPPPLGALEMHMVGLQQRQKKVDVEQRPHGQTSSSSHFLTISDVMIWPVRGSRRKPLR